MNKKRLNVEKLNIQDTQNVEMKTLLTFIGNIVVLLNFQWYVGGGELSINV